MSGKCYSCASSFGAFKKELACKNCGFSFCNDCIQKKTKVPKCNNAIHKVCNKCYDILTGKTVPTKAVIPPPDSHVKRMAALNKGHGNSKAGSSKGHASSRTKDEELSRRLDRLKTRPKNKERVPTQKEIEDRVSKLRPDPADIPSEEELTERLSRLKGEATGNENAVSSLPPSGEKTHSEQVEELIGYMQSKIDLDSAGQHADAGQNNLNKDDGVKGAGYTPNVTLSDAHREAEQAARLLAEANRQMQQDTKKALAELKADKAFLQQDSLRWRSTGIPERQNISLDDNEAYVTDEEEEEEEIEEDKDVNKIIKQLMAEEALEEKVENVEVFDEPTKTSTKKKSKTDRERDSEDEELPWCCICTEDAIVRCAGCENDLYCKRCFKEAHNRFDMNEHKTVPFVPSS